MSEAVTRRGLLSLGVRAVPVPAVPARPVPVRAPAAFVAEAERAVAEAVGDGVFSAFELEYEPSERVGARDLWDATAPGGLAGVASWATSGFMGRLLALTGGAPAAQAWGRHESLAFTLAEFDEVEVAERMLTWRVADADELLALLGGVPTESRREAGRLVERFALAGDDGLTVRVGWLLTCARKPSWA